METEAAEGEGETAVVGTEEGTAASSEPSRVKEWALVLRVGRAAVVAEDVSSDVLIVGFVLVVVGV